jgi:hypothetical protein
MPSWSTDIEVNEQWMILSSSGKGGIVVHSPPCYSKQEALRGAANLARMIARNTNAGSIVTHLLGSVIYTRAGEVARVFRVVALESPR